MKSLKAAAVLAGSMVVAGIAAPAVALDAAEVKPGVAGVVNQAAEGTVGLVPLDQTRVLGAEKGGLVPGTVKDAKATLAQQAEGHLLDGRTLQV
ncbi:hypothetical protein [Streptomyces sp. NPDC052701]|uniref:hypothetical protein n=1 Tax=Streptomyces sp. NPDC052701 TaxID=3155533 RepID=UPI00341B6C2E